MDNDIRKIIEEHCSPSAWDALEKIIRERSQGSCKEICICAAVKATDGTVVRGHRHGFCMQAIIYMGKQVDRRSEAQGFITSRNRYVTREDGRKLQDAAGIPSADLPDGYKGDTLFSEDLY